MTNKASKTNRATTIRVYYCSTGIASSTEDGTLKNPFKTLEKAMQMVPDNSTLLLERGYEYPYFYRLYNRSINLGAYGCGNAPVVSRFAKVKNTTKNLFSKDDSSNNIWTLNTDLLTELSGRSADDLKNIGFIYSPYTDRIVFGHRVAFVTAIEAAMAFDYEPPTQAQLQAFSYLDKDGDFYQSADGKTIKVYSSTNPNESDYPNDFNKLSFGEDPHDVQELWFATSGNFLNNSHDCTISDLKIVGYAGNALLCSENNLMIKNVEFDLIGGAAIDPTKVNTTQFQRQGHGVEVWSMETNELPISGIIICGCRFSRIFSQGVAINGYTKYGINCGATNIVIKKCEFINCRGAFGVAIYSLNDNGTIAGIGAANDVHFKYNKSVITSSNAFNSPEPLDAHLFCGIPGPVISNNVFYNGNLQFRYTNKVGFNMGAGNICHIRPGQFMIQESTDTRKYVYYPEHPTKESVSDAVAAYRAMAHDEHTMFIELGSFVSET